MKNKNNKDTSISPLRISILLLYLTLKQHGFELHGSTYMQIFFNSKYCITTQSTTWLHPWIQNVGYGKTMETEGWL